MLLNSRTTRLLVEAAEDACLSRASMLDPLGLTYAEVMDEHARVEWRTLTRIVQQVSLLVDDDEERLREIGRRMARTPSYAPLRRLSGIVLSVRSLYDIANRFAGPANFPHIVLNYHFVNGRMHLRCEIPSPYEPSAPFFHVFEGSVLRLPRLLDLPDAVTVTRRVTPRTLDLVVELPESSSIVDRVRRGARAVVGARDALAVLHEQQRELARSVQALRGARDELRLLLDGLPDLVLVHASGTVLWANRAFLTALGPEAPADLVTDTPSMREIAVTTPSGAEVMLEVAPTQAVVFDGVPARLVVGRDVTDRTRMRQKLIVADRLASVGLLAAGVAHEVNNPLAYVLNNIEIAHRELGALGPAADVSRDALSVALEGVDRIRTIVRDLLMLSRGDEAAPRAIDVGAVAESTLALAAHDIERTTRLVRDFQPSPPVHASDARVAQVLLNLLANALEAMRGRPRDDNELVVRVTRAADGRMLMAVSDNGSGISEHDLPRLFEPFFTTKPLGQGTGLGLSIAHRLVVEIGGEIAVTSVPGRGTTFQVLLPAAGVTPS